MFGYVRAYRPYLRVYELELYKGVYCGICRTISERYGFVSALPMSYDLVLLTLMKMALDGKMPAAEMKRCPLHPVTKRRCVHCSDGKNEAFELAADAHVVLMYHKLGDDVHDRAFKHKLAAASYYPVMAAAYKKASKLRPGLAEAVGGAMKRQYELEKSGVRSLDRAAEPTAAMTAAVFRELGGFDPDLRVTLSQFGYLLGRYVYICDALDDLYKDVRSSDYNPLISAGLRRVLRADPQNGHAVQKAIRAAENSMRLTLGELAEVYARIDMGEYKPIIDNIIYLGSNEVFSGIKKKTLEKGQKGDKRHDRSV